MDYAGLNDEGPNLCGPFLWWSWRESKPTLYQAFWHLICRFNPFRFDSTLRAALKSKGLCRRGRDLTPQVRHRRTASHMDRIRKQNYVGIGAWVHPKRGSGEAGVAEASDGEDHSPCRGVGSIDIPAEAAQVFTRDRRVVRG